MKRFFAFSQVSQGLFSVFVWKLSFIPLHLQPKKKYEYEKDSNDIGNDVLNGNEQ